VEKLSFIENLSRKAVNNLLVLNDTTYETLIAPPRPYSLIVFATATHPKFKCTICKDIDSSLQKTSQSYLSQHTNEQGQQNNIFFIKLDYQDSQETFNKYQISSVPVIFHVGEDDSSSSNEEHGTDSDHEDRYILSSRNKFQMSSNSISPNDIAEFVKDRTGYNVQIAQSNWGVYISIITFVLILIFLIPHIIASMDTLWLPLIRSKLLWIIVSATVYTCTISGFIFDIIRAPPLYYADPRSGQFMFFYPQSGNQFIVEGFIIGMFNLVCAFSLIFLTVICPKFKSTDYKNVSIIVCLTLFAVFFWQIRNLYRMKNRWYGMT
jgi:oligosaccharyltransferase complex subunit gamma